MLRLFDDRGEFDAPIDLLWEYLGHEDEHRAAHPTVRNHEVREISPGLRDVAVEQKYGSQWFRSTERLSVFAPLGMASEAVEGHMAGSKYFVYYTPRGPRTGVAVVGDFRSTEFPDAQLGPMIGLMFEQFFEEDQERLRAYRRARERPTR
jgi:hypothetical protein